MQKVAVQRQCQRQAFACCASSLKRDHGRRSLSSVSSKRNVSQAASQRPIGDRVLSAAPYLLPMLDGLKYGVLVANGVAPIVVLCLLHAEACLRSKANLVFNTSLFSIHCRITLARKCMAQL